MTLIDARDYKDMSRKAANLIAAQVILHPGSVLGLATGSTPIGIYEQLAERCSQGDLDFSQVTTVNLDEYCGLDPADSQSYRTFMNRHLFDRINIDPQRTHVPSGLAEPEEECARYERLIADCGGIDLQLLGLGHNGHIGFNEPGDAFATLTHCVQLADETILANQRFFASADEVPRKAITMGLQTIMRAKKILLVVSGKEKAAILDRALHGPVTPAVPASILQFHPDLTVIASVKD